MAMRDLIWLLYTARDRFTSVQVEWDYEVDTDRMAVALDRWARTRPPGSVATITARQASDASSDAARRSIHRSQRRVWWRKPGCWRDEYQAAGEPAPAITVLCNGRWRIHNALVDAAGKEDGPVNVAVTPPAGSSPPPQLEDRLLDAPLLDPAYLLATHALEFVGDAAHAGRAALDVRATYRKGHSHLFEPMFWASADDYMLRVDAERGVLLRYAARLDGEAYAVAAVTSIRFDSPIPDSIFLTEASPPALT